eukprot:scaffold50201_cov50-Attheya_sp.AAC.2
MSCRGCRLIGIERNRGMVWNAPPPSIIRSSSLAFHVPTTSDEGSISRSKQGCHKDTTCQDSSALFGWSASVVLRNTNRHHVVSFFFLVSILYR